MNLFPSGIAEKEAFCNRIDERKHLKQYIDHTQHTVLMAPRRYGKTSLITQVMHDNKYMHVWVDFLPITTQEEVEQKLQLAAKHLLPLLSPELKKIQRQTINKLKSMSPELNLKAMGQSLTLHLATDSHTPIDQTLTEIDKYAQKINKKAVLVFDEFQQVGEIKKNLSIEALIRHAVERSKNITYLFSGSNRHLLHEMFSRSNRPLYRLCNAIQLTRIKETDYIPFINHAAKLRWKKTIANELIEEILRLTECHSFYVNALCSELWLDKEPPKNLKKIEITWLSYVTQHKSIIISDIITLPLNQKKIIRTLSNEPENEPYSSQFSIKLGISTASIRRAIEALLLKDIIFQDEKGYYRVLDPAVSYYLKP